MSTARQQSPHNEGLLVRRPRRNTPVSTTPGNIAVFADSTGLVLDDGGKPGVTVIASGNLSGAALTITSIPPGYAELYLSIVGASCDTASRHLDVQCSTNNGSSYDTTAANYNGYTVAGATLAAISDASLIQTADVAAANLHTVGLLLSGYQTGAPVLARSYVSNGTTKYLCECAYLTAAAVNALKVLWSSSGNFDAGTFSLVGLR